MSLRAAALHVDTYCSNGTNNNDNRLTKGQLARKSG